MLGLRASWASGSVKVIMGLPFGSTYYVALSVGLSGRVVSGEPGESVGGPGQ